METPSPQFLYFLGVYTYIYCLLGVLYRKGHPVIERTAIFKFIIDHYIVGRQFVGKPLFQYLLLFYFYGPLGDHVIIILQVFAVGLGPGFKIYNAHSFFLS